MKKDIIPIFLTLILILGFVATVSAAQPGFGQLYYDGDIVRTVVPPAAMPKPGRDNLYRVTNGVQDQLGIAAVAPGDKDYHGGQWAIHLVTWTSEPYLLTSEQDVLDAASNGFVIIIRSPQDDFRCPIQP